MLTEKPALMTGSTSGIGLGIAEHVARASARIVLNGLGDAAEIEATWARIGATHGVEVRFRGTDQDFFNDFQEATYPLLV